MDKKEKDKLLQDILDQQDIQNFKENLNRARSITVGTAFGGVTEVSMRGPGGAYLFCPLQPVEIIELIHQLAANVGCHLNLQPRQDFSSWRDWKYTEQELLHYKGEQPLPGVGWAPHVNDMAPHNQLGANLPPPDLQPGLSNPKLKKNKEIENESTVATKKIVNKRGDKRASKVT
jgi:hypothetical protein